MPNLIGEVELEKSYFGSVRKIIRERDATRKVPVFGILKRGGRVYTQIFDNTRTDMIRRNTRWNHLTNDIVAPKKIKKRSIILPLIVALAS